MDFGKPDRYLFLHSEYQSHKWGKITAVILLLLVIYFGFHITNAVASTYTPIVVMPDGTITRCIVNGGVVQCF